MSLITRCPACGTLFKVVPDQLRISQGWVRCGQCAEVFDASSDLRQAAVERVEPPALPPSNPTDAADAWDAGPSFPAWSNPSPMVPDAIDGPQPLHASDQVAVADMWQLAQAVPASDAESAISEPAIDAAIADAPVDESAHDPVDRSPEIAVEEPSAELASDPADTLSGSMPLPERPTADQPADPVREPTLVAPQDSVHRNLSFIRNAPTVESRWRTSLRRAAWVFAGVALLAGLGLQIVLQERDRIAAAAPATLRWLQALCAPVHCAVQPLRDIEAIVIDGSSFSALRTDGYRLGVTVRNRADHALALPAIELSLTDIEEQPVVRRVLLPTEMGALSLTIAARGDWSTSVDLSLVDKAGRARVVGYRLLAFYP